MPRFIELHTYNKSPIFINLDTVAYIEEDFGYRNLLQGKIINRRINRWKILKYL